MQLSHLTTVLVAFIGLVSAGFLEDHKEFFNQLERSAQETKRALTEEQQKDISSIVDKISGLAEGQSQREFIFTEPIFTVPKLYIPAAISEYLHSKENLGSIDQLEVLFDEHRGMEFYQDKFEQNIGKPCEQLLKIWTVTLDAFYAIQRPEELFKQIKKYDVKDSQMLLNAGFCHIVMEDPKKSAIDAFIFFGCTIMNPGQSCYL